MSKSEAHPATDLAQHEREILTAWADTHKKSALMLFILLRLHGQPGWSQDMRHFIDSCTDEHLGVDKIAVGPPPPPATRDDDIAVSVPVDGQR